MGPASAYATVFSSIDNDVRLLLESQPNIFTFSDLKTGVVEIRDFQTTGVVANARGCPFYNLNPGRQEILGQTVQIREDYRQNYIKDIADLVSKKLHYNL